MVSLQVPSEACVSPVPSPVGSGRRRSWKAMREGVQKAPGRGEGERGEGKIEEGGYSEGSGQRPHLEIMAHCQLFPFFMKVP